MYANYIFVIFLLMLNVNVEDRMFWDERNDLTWSDFKMTDKLNVNESALISTGIDVKWNLKGSNLKITVRSYVNRDKSYVIKGKQSDELLLHERYHFHIAEIYARKLRRELINIKFTKENYKNEITSVFNLNKKERNKYQNLYDKETNHSKKSLEQEYWNEKIDNELKELEKYNNINIYRDI